MIYCDVYEHFKINFTALFSNRDVHAGIGNLSLRIEGQFQTWFIEKIRCDLQ